IAKHGEVIELRVADDRRGISPAAAAATLTTRAGCSRAAFARCRVGRWGSWRSLCRGRRRSGARARAFDLAKDVLELHYRGCGEIAGLAQTGFHQIVGTLALRLIQLLEGDS